MGEEKHKVMIIDDDITNLTIAKKALEHLYTPIPVSSGKKAIELLNRVTPALILLDIEMPELDGFGTFRLLKENAKTQDIPIVFLTAKRDDGSELEGLKLGAVDYIVKPFSVPLLAQRVQLHIQLEGHKNQLRVYNTKLHKMVKEQTEIIEELQHAIMHTFIDLIEFRDGATGSHVVRTREYLKLLVDTLDLSGYYQQELSELDVPLLLESSQLHDIGKIAVSDTILQKPGRLTPDEFEEIKKHTLVGEAAIRHAMEMTRSKAFLQIAATIAVSHHEKWDGTGYPRGLKGCEIPLSGRLMAIVDVYDALVSHRPYKQAYPHAKAVDIIVRDSGKHFDPLLVEVFLKRADDFELISKVIDRAQLSHMQPVSAGVLAV